MVVLFLFAIIGSGLLIWGIIYSNIKIREKKDSDAKISEAKIDLLGYIKRSAGSAVPKITIMMDLEINPKELKQLIEILINDGFITETIHNIKITDFGKQYYDKFVIK